MQGAKVNLRALDKSDIEKEFVWWNDKEITDKTEGGISGPISRTDFEKMFEENFLKVKENARWFAIETKKEEFIGDIGLTHIDWKNGNALIAVTLGEREFRGKGYGIDAINTLLSFAFLELGLHRIEIGCYEFNEAAIRCFKMCGFREEGRQKERLYRDGKYWDSINYGLLRKQWDAHRRKDS